MKITAIIPHVVDGPAKDAPGKVNISRIKVFEFNQCYNALGNAVDVNRIGLVMKIFRDTIFTEKMISIERKTTLDTGFKFIRF